MDPITSALIHASRTGNLPLLQEIIDQNNNLEVQDDKGYTPLIIASYNHQLAAARLLLQSGADVNGKDAGGNTALMGVCFKGYTDIAELLITHPHVNLNALNGNGGTALMFAVMFGRNELTQLLLNHGAEVNITDNRGMDALGIAVQQGNEQGLLLLKQHLSINQ
nr:ankyrin repeat domain-containing protein [Pedobacter panaciterrae]